MNAAETRRRRSFRIRPLGIIGPELPAAVLADWLFWDHRVGLSLALFCAALAAAAHLTRPGSPWLRGAAAALVLIVGLAPAVEDLSLISVAFALLSTSFAAGLAIPARAPNLLNATAAAARWIAGPRRIYQDLSRRAVWRRRHRQLRPSRWPGRLAWAMPAAVVSVFLALFADANPIIADALAALPRPTLDLLPSAPRAVFWVAVAVAVWPVVRPRRTPRRPTRASTASAAAVLPDIPSGLRTILFGEVAVLRALLLCNGLFALQLALDGAYLWAGLALPHGMSYAEYAHRGAYPLVLTALVAGGFVLLVRRSNRGTGNPGLLVGLQLLFTGQNFLLVGSAARRLGLYVGAYGLTEWRVAALCWMGLVACGLALVAVQVLAGRDNAWLASRSAVAAAVVLYGWCLADVPGLVARYDVAHCAEVAGSGPPLDTDTLLDLGPSALPAIDAVWDRLRPVQAIVVLGPVRDRWARAVHQQAADWRAWSFRAWRLAHYLDSVEGAAPRGRPDDRKAS